VLPLDIYLRVLFVSCCYSYAYAMRPLCVNNRAETGQKAA